MKKDTSPRVMWLLNHSSARKFELAMMKRLGVREIFLPKSFPADSSFRGSSVDWSHDADLSIPIEDLSTLNQADWYAGASPDAWQVASKHFDIAFVLAYDPNLLVEASKYFAGALVWRNYGQNPPNTYARVLSELFDCGIGQKATFNISKRFWLGESYPYPYSQGNECDLFPKRHIYLPLGVTEKTSSVDGWNGNKSQIVFDCPDIVINPYSKESYVDFKATFGDLPYVVTGDQPITVADASVVGSVTSEEQTAIMRESRVMFYRGLESNLPPETLFEAIQLGVPVIFMAGGILDFIGFQSLPGRCNSTNEARHKVKRLLSNDRRLIKEIITSQQALLEYLKPEKSEVAWRAGFSEMISELKSLSRQKLERPKTSRRKKVAIIVPVCCKGSALWRTFALAKALYLGSREWGEGADIVYAHLDDAQIYTDDDFIDLPNYISRRAYSWETLTAPESRRAMRYAGFQGWTTNQVTHIVPNDGMQHLLDCDLWLIAGDNLTHRVLPMRPVILMVHDYSRRYEVSISRTYDQSFLNAARQAALILVDAKCTQQDAIQYAGVASHKVRRLPMMAPIRKISISRDLGLKPYFLWITRGINRDGSQERAVEALRIYYEDFGGKWACKVIDVSLLGVSGNGEAALNTSGKIFKIDRLSKMNVEIVTELSDQKYKSLLSQAGFWWHTSQFDNEMFSVIDAGCSGVPVLSFDYMAMREIDEHFGLMFSWISPNAPRQMAEGLKRMEHDAAINRKLLVQRDGADVQGIELHAKSYWGEVRACL